MNWFKLAKQMYGYWIAPDGKIIPVFSRQGHFEVARKLGFYDTEDVLLNNYLRVIIQGEPVFETSGKITDAQAKIVSDLAKELDKEIFVQYQGKWTSSLLAADIVYFLKNGVERSVKLV
ncbi:MAG: hypothetical protein WDA06_06520 [Phenylobacterium sp.]